MEIVIDCPLGAKCESIGEDKKLHRCAWYTKIIGQDPQTLKEIDEWKCAIAWQPILQVEVCRTTRATTSAVESFRNESVTGQNTFNQILITAAGQKQLGDG